MSIDRRKAALFGAAAALRLLLFTSFPGLPDLLMGRVEISTPVTSFKRRGQKRRYFVGNELLTLAPVQEGLFLYTHNVSPYDGGVYHQAPLLLPLFSLLPDFSTYPIFAYIVYIIVDVFSADALMKIAETGEACSSRFFTSPRREKRWSSIEIGAL